MATLLFDLLTPRRNATALTSSTSNFWHGAWSTSPLVAGQPDTAALPVGYFGASTARVRHYAPPLIRGDGKSGRLTRRAAGSGGRVADQSSRATLLIVGGRDEMVLELNRRAQAAMPAHANSPWSRATHLFEEPGTSRGCGAGRDWFINHLSPALTTARPARQAMVDNTSGIAVCRTRRICGSRCGRPPAWVASGSGAWNLKDGLLKVAATLGRVGKELVITEPKSARSRERAPVPCHCGAAEGAQSHSGGRTTARREQWTIRSGVHHRVRCPVDPRNCCGLSRSHQRRQALRMEVYTRCATAPPSPGLRRGAHQAWLTSRHAAPEVWPRRRRI